MKENFYNQWPFGDKIKRIALKSGVSFEAVAVAVSLSSKFVFEHGEGFLQPLMDTLVEAKARRGNLRVDGDIDETVPVAKKLVLSFGGDMEKAAGLCKRVAREFKGVWGWDEYVFVAGPIVNNCVRPGGEPTSHCSDALSMTSYESWIAKQRKIQSVRRESRFDGALGVMEESMAGRSVRGRRAPKNIKSDWVPR